MRGATLCLAVLAMLLHLTSCRSAHSPSSPRQVSPASEAAWKQTLKVWSAGDQAGAESLLEEAAGKYPGDQRIAFFRAACQRSRFDVEAALPLFQAVERLDDRSVYGRAAGLIVTLDTTGKEEAGFDELERLAVENPKDPLLTWMTAVQCRSFELNFTGIKHYRRLLSMVGPGPVLVHQTFANLLDEADEHEEALKHRKLAVELEPAPWSYHGLALTLNDLDRYEEAVNVARAATRLFPEDPALWKTWGFSLCRMKKHREALAKYETALRITPDDSVTLSNYGFCLTHNGRFEDAIKQCRKAIAADPRNRLAYLNEADAYEKMGKRKDAEEVRKAMSAAGL